MKSGRKPHKSGHLHEIEDIDSLRKHVEKFINKFNNEIPNDVHKGLTDEEVFDRITFDKENHKRQKVIVIMIRKDIF